MDSVFVEAMRSFRREIWKSIASGVGEEGMSG